MTIRALGIEHEANVVDLFTGEHKKAPFLAINPKGQVPAIKDGDLCLSESRAIQTYLCTKYAQGQKKDLYPDDPAARSKVDQMLYIGLSFANMTVNEYPAIRRIIFEKKPIDESKRPMLVKGLDEIEGYLTENKFYAGENFTVADISLYVYIRNLDIVPGGFDFSPWPKLTEWLAYIQNLPYHDVSQKEGLGILQSVVHGSLAPPKIQFYHNFLSPFSRAVHMTLKALDIPFDLHPIDLAKGEQRSEEYLKINPKGKVPAIKIGDFCMSESRAIATFLVSQYADEDHKHLYPEDTKLRAKVDMLLYQGQGTFDAMNKWMGCFNYFFRDGMPGEDTSGFDKALADLEQGVEGKFLTGDKMTVADILLYVPVIWSQVTTNYDYTPYPKLSAVFQNMKALPYHDEVNMEAFEFVTNKIEEKMARLNSAAAPPANNQLTGF